MDLDVLVALANTKEMKLVDFCFEQPHVLWIDRIRTTDTD